MEAALGSFRGMNSSHTAIYMLGTKPSLTSGHQDVKMSMYRSLKSIRPCYLSFEPLSHILRVAAQYFFQRSTHPQRFSEVSDILL